VKHLRLTFFLILFPGILIHASTVSAQGKGEITGLVLDHQTQKPIADANILLQPTVLGTTSNGEGFFSISGIQPGIYTLTVSVMGYEVFVLENIELGPNQTVHQKVELDETILQMDPVVVTAGKHPQALSVSPQAAVVVQQADITQRQNRRFEEVLQPISGIHFNESNISIRGSSGYSVLNVGSRVMLMIDGVPSLSSDLNLINWEMLPLLDVDRIEVIKGAGSALYGSSAMGGVINIITRSPSRKGRLLIRTLTGFYDKPHYPEWRWTNKPLHYQRFDIAYSKSVGPVGFRLAATRSQSTGYMENSDLSQWNISGKVNWTLPNASKLNVYAAWMDSKAGWLTQWLNQNQPFEVPPFNKQDEFHYKTLNLYIQYHLPISSKFAFKFRVSHMLSEMGSQIFGGGSVYTTQSFQPGEGLGGELLFEWIPGVRQNVILGTEYRRDISGSRYFDNHKGYMISPFVQWEFDILSNLKTVCGARWDRHILDDKEIDSRLSPKFGINFKPWKKTTLRATAGSGFRTATVFEKYVHADYSGFNVIMNPDLKPEHSWFADAGIRQIFSPEGYVEISFFQTDYWNMIEPVFSFLGEIQFQNTVRARIRGVEFSTQSWWWKRHIGLGAQVTWMEPRDLKRNTDLSYRPRLIANVQSTLRFGSFSVQAEYRYASLVRNVEINPLDPCVPLKLLTIRSEFQIRQVTIQFAVNNVLNYHYTQIERRMGEIRNASIGLLLDIGQ